MLWKVTTEDWPSHVTEPRNNSQIYYLGPNFAAFDFVDS